MKVLVKKHSDLGDGSGGSEGERRRLRRLERRSSPSRRKDKTDSCDSQKCPREMRGGFRSALHLLMSTITSAEWKSRDLVKSDMYTFLKDTSFNIF